MLADLNVRGTNFARQVDEFSTRIFGSFKPLVAFCVIVAGLYLYVTLTQPLNIDSMNSLDGQPLPKPYEVILPTNGTHGNTTLTGNDNFKSGNANVYFLA